LFVPQWREEESKGNVIVLLMDGCASHARDDRMLLFCFHQIIQVFLPLMRPTISSSPQWDFGNT
jgi:hypothetical protein